MTMPNPEERRIFIDAPNPTCKKCIHANKKETEKPCVNCKWLTSIMGDSDFYEEGKKK